jgi:nucleoside-diphosphate-sugar epimerase
VIIGSGVLARAFAPYFSSSTSECVYAAGVSNSSCKDPTEYQREMLRLTDALTRYQHADLFIYFGTCSVNDPLANSTPYVQHKVRMEKIVANHPRHLILRLPQLAANTVNPHTLLNYIFARVSRSERFQVWKNARRNIIDVDDVVRIAVSLAKEDGLRGECVNIANFLDISVPDIVEIMAQVVGKKSVCDYLNYGGAYPIDAGRIRHIAERCGVLFNPEYTEHVIRKYYA